MRTTISLSAFLSLTLIFAANLSSAQMERFSGNPFSAPAATYHYARNRDYHVEHLKLIFNINAVNHSAEGIVTHTLAPLRDGLDKVIMDAGANLKILSCRISGREVKYAHIGDKLNIFPDSPLKRGVYVNVQIHYLMPGGITAGGANGLGGFHWTLPNKEAPNRPVQFWTQGETQTNREWVPCYDYPNDKCTSETITTVPQSWVVIGNGAEGPVTTDAIHHTKTYRWTMPLPHSTYLLSLVGGELSVTHRTWEGVPLLYVAPKDRGNLAAYSFSDTPDMLSFYSKILNFKYPWPKYAEDAMDEFGGGMENVSATTLGAYSLVNPREGRHRTDSLTSHELAHQWFGDTVTCKDWGNIWLNESFATFMEMTYMHHRFGEEQWQSEKEQYRQEYLAGAKRYLRPVVTKFFSNPDAVFDAYAYPKGGLILEMLRYQIGDVNFFRGLHHYLEVYKFRPVTTHDLIECITDATGINVQPFFDEWLYKPGNPIMDMTWNYDTANKQADITLKQLQNTSDGIPIYNTPVTIGLISSANSDHLQRVTVTLNQKEQQFKIPVNFTPDAVLLDPDHELLKQKDHLHWTASELLPILLYAPDYLDRIEAAKRLAGEGMNPERKQLFLQVLQTDPSWHIAQYMMGLLTPTGDPTVRPILLKQAESTQPERVESALKFLGDLPKEPTTMKLIKKYASSDSARYSAVEGAIDALAKLDVADNMLIFAEQLKSSSPFDLMALTVVNALSSTHNNAVAPLLTSVASSSKYFSFTRIAAVSGLQKLALHSDPIHACLVKLLMDKNQRLVRSAVHALQERHDTEALTLLKELAAHTSNAETRQAADDAVANLSAKG